MYKRQAYVYQKNSQILNLSQAVDGWTMTLTDCIGDDNRLYVGIEVTAPEGTVPVSYTHLDVYKRQGLVREYWAGSPWRALRDCVRGV